MDEYDAKSSDPSAKVARKEGLDKNKAKSCDKLLFVLLLLDDDDDVSLVAVAAFVVASSCSCAVLLLLLLATVVVNCWRDEREEGIAAAGAVGADVARILIVDVEKV